MFKFSRFPSPQRLVLGIAFAFVFNVVPEISLAQTDLDSFSVRLDKFAQGLLEDGFAPGAAVLVVRGDQTIFNRGYGMTDGPGSIQISPDTVFYIASSTKSFTGLAATICAERNELDLDATLADYLGDASYHDSIVAAEITLRDLMSHTHGISNDGPVPFRLAYSGQHTEPQLKELLKYHGPAKNGRKFEYGNIGFNVAGLAMKNHLGLHWKDLLQREIFGPLDMNSTTGFVSKIDCSRLAMPYSLEGKGYARIHYGKSDSNMHAAGGLVTTTNDLAKWLKVNINDGQLDGVQVLPEKAVATTHKPIASQNASYMSFKRTGYGLGWNTGSYENNELIHHFGGFSGFHCHISFMPKENIGVAVLVNTTSGSMFADLVSRFAYDSLLEKPDFKTRYSDSAMAKYEQQLASVRQRIQADRDRRAARSQKLSHPLDAFAGTYSNELLGEVKFDISDGKLEASMGPLKSKVEVYDANTNSLRVELTGSGSIVRFKFGEKGDAEHFTFNGLEFTRLRKTDVEMID